MCGEEVVVVVDLCRRRRKMRSLSRSFSMHTHVFLFCKHAVHFRHACVYVGLVAREERQSTLCGVYAYPGILLLIFVVCIVAVVEDVEMYTESFVCRRRKVLCENVTVVHC